MTPGDDDVFTVKICGLTTPDEARMVAAAGADSVGLNFVAGSPRRLGIEDARRVAAAVPPAVLVVGVFAGTPAGEILEVAREVRLDAIQLHGHLSGDEGPVDPPRRCLELVPLPVIRAVRLDPPSVGDDRLRSARRWLAAAVAAGRPASMVLVDAAVRATSGQPALGGTGETVDWTILARAEPLSAPMVLAGGLTPENVATAIRISGLTSVDAASGVESAPGRKDPAKVRAFVAAARRALDGV